MSSTTTMNSSSNTPNLRPSEHVTPSRPHSPDTNGTNSATGTWTSSIRTPIALTRKDENQYHTHVTAHRSWIVPIIGALLAAAVILLNSANLIDVYGNIFIWSAAAIPAALLGVCIALAAISPTLRLWWQIVFLIVAQFLAGPMIALNDTTIAHILPSLQTLSQGFTQTFGSFKYIIAVIPPIGSTSGSLMALWTLNLWTSFLAGVFAVSANNTINLITVLPLGLNLVASALLGTDQGTLRPLCSIMAMFALIFWLSWRWHSLDMRRPISAAIIIVISVALAFGAASVIPEHRLILRDHYDPPFDPHQYTSPLSGMRSYVKYHKKEMLLTVSGLPAGTPVRLAVMDRFDGNVWNLSDSTDASDSSDYRKIGSGIPTTADGSHFNATFKVHKGFSEQWLPLVGDASSIDFGSNDLYYNTGTHSAIAPNTSLGGRTYTESGIVPHVPTQQQIVRASAQNITQPETKDVPNSAGSLAPALTGKQHTDGATAQTLATALKTKGWFSHGLAGDYPSLPGHGNFRIGSMLGGSAMVGDSEQYASAMALMARQLNLPSRVVLGFIPKDKEGDISKARTTTNEDGTTRTDFTGNDIEAWVEINLKGYGWVAFYPTPKETKVPNKNQDLTPPNPKTLVRQPPVPLVDPLHDQNQARDQSALDGADVDNQNRNATLIRIIAIAKKVAVYGSPLWTILIICGLIMLIKATQLAIMARRGSSKERIVSGWKAIDMLAKQSGIVTSGTRRQQVMQIHNAFSTSTEKTSTSITGKSVKAQRQHGIPAGSIDLNQLKLLSREADWVAFSGKELDETDSLAYWKRIQTMRKAILAAQPRMRRIATRLSLKGVFHMPNLQRFKPKQLLSKNRRAKFDDASSTTATAVRPDTISTNTANGTAILTGERLKPRDTEKKGHRL
jgi:MFS family permease